MNKMPRGPMISQSMVARSLGALTVAATLIFPAMSATAREWERGRSGPPYGWAKGHDKWKEKYDHQKFGHKWEHGRPPYWAGRPVERRYGHYHYEPYYGRPRPNVIYRPRPHVYRDRYYEPYYGRSDPYVIYRPKPHVYGDRYDVRGRVLERDWTDLGNARDEVRQGREQLRQHKDELKKDRAELRRDLRSGASKAEIRQDRQEIREDRQKIAATRKELRRDRATVRAERR